MSACLVYKLTEMKSRSPWKAEAEIVFSRLSKCFQSLLLSLHVGRSSTLAFWPTAVKQKKWKWQFECGDVSAFILIEITLLLPPKRLRRSRPIVKRPRAPSETQYLCGVGVGVTSNINDGASSKKTKKVKAVRGSRLEVGGATGGEGVFVAGKCAAGGRWLERRGRKRRGQS